MQQWKRTILHTGVSLSLLGGGALIAAGTAGAHDAADPATPAVPFPHAVQGVVTTLGVNSFTITTHKGTTETIDTTLTTTFAETGTPVAPTGVAVGQAVIVALDPGAATPTAVRVTVHLDRVSGKVLDVSSTSITLAGPKDSTRDVIISSSTEYFSGKTTATGVTVGEFVTAWFTRNTSTPTDLDALFVDSDATSVHPDGGPVVSPALPNPVGPRHGNKDATPHAPTTLPTVPDVRSTVPGTSHATPVAGTFGRTAPGTSSVANHDTHGSGHGDGGGASSGGGTGSQGRGGRG
jgi:hypothetical protein